MNQNEVKFVAGLNSLASLCKTELSEWLMEAYLSTFKDRWDDGIKALKIAFMKVRPNQGMPSPHDLLSLLGEITPQAMTSRDLGTEAANSILSAVGRFGGYRAVEAKQSLGGHLWRIVEAMGGWEALCMIDIDDLPTWRAQIRDAAEGFAKADYFKGNLAIEGSKSNVAGILEGLSTGLTLKI